MEVNEDGFLEELVSLGREAWEVNNSTQINDFLTNNWGFDPLPPPISPTPFECFSSPIRPTLLDSSFSDLFLSPHLADEFTSYHNLKKLETPSFQSQDEFSIPIVDDESGFKLENNVLQAACKVEVAPTMEIPSFNMEFCMEKKKNKKRKLEGQPSKNLMAERRRRKRLNDRLSMLRSVVPKISKMDRTSILGDTIDYMKELLQRINNLQEETDVNSTIFKNIKPDDVLLRTTPKFDVERRNADTRIEIYSTGKPGLLLSTMTTLEALGLEIQQCVISCFNDFSLQASCSEESDGGTLVSSEDIKQALFQNAGYGGKYM
uniref:BHLH3 n=1 Tax=Fagopyrum tataricum TaxID=62330 RepID=A0A172QPL3_FAGTA|nr:bHLH3 [Fagopyrum tataricum]